MHASVWSPPCTSGEVAAERGFPKETVKGGALNADWLWLWMDESHSSFMFFGLGVALADEVALPLVNKQLFSGCLLY